MKALLFSVFLTLNSVIAQASNTIGDDGLDYKCNLEINGQSHSLGVKLPFNDYDSYFLVLDQEIIKVSSVEWKKDKLSGETIIVIVSDAGQVFIPKNNPTRATITNKDQTHDLVCISIF